MVRLLLRAKAIFIVLVSLVIISSGIDFGSQFALNTDGLKVQTPSQEYTPNLFGVNTTTSSGNSYCINQFLITIHSPPTGLGDYQQLIIITNSTILNGLNAAHSNFLITFMNGAPAYAWIQSYNLTSMTIWVKVYLGTSSLELQEYPKSETFFSSSSSYVGEAPQLSTVYGEFDNGALIFPYYNNFADHSGWQIINPNNGEIRLENGLHVTEIGTTPVSISTNQTFDQGNTNYYFYTQTNNSASARFLGRFVANGAFYGGLQRVYFYGIYAEVNPNGEGQNVSIGVTSYLNTGDYNLYKVEGSRNFVYAFSNLTVNGRVTASSYYAIANRTSANGTFYFVTNGNNGDSLNLTYWFTTNSYSMPAVSFEPLQRVYPVTFSEFGLRQGLNWWIIVDNMTKSSYLSSISFLLANGSYDYTVCNLTGYNSSPSFGVISVNGSTSGVTIAFVQIITFVFIEEGLPSGTMWSVVFNGSYYNSTSPVIIVDINNGTYGYVVLFPHGYFTSPRGGVIGWNTNIIFVKATSIIDFTIAIAVCVSAIFAAVALILYLSCRRKEH